MCDIAEPRTGLEGKFSLRATTAMALLGDDTSDPAAFTDARMASAELRGDARAGDVRAAAGAAIDAGIGAS